MGWRFPNADEVVMDFLTTVLDDDVWVGTWEPNSEHTGPVVLVARQPSQTEDETRFVPVEIEVETDSRGYTRELAATIADELQDLAGGSVDSVLVDDVVEAAGPAPERDDDDLARVERMVYTLAFRKHYFREEN